MECILKIHDKREFEWEITIVQELGEAFKKQDKTMCQELYKHAKGKIDRLMETFSGFSQLCL